MSPAASPADRPDDALLPRLLYIGDLPVDTGPGSPAVLYRLLQTYPKDKLAIVEGRLVSRPDRRIPGVAYHEYKSFWTRLLMTRFHTWASAGATLSAELSGRRLVPIRRDFRPQAVLTLAWGYKWATAAAFAKRAGLPLHLVVHDDWPNVSRRVRVESLWMDWRLRHWYPQAASRLCVCPYTADEYGRRYCAPGDVLWPSRGLNDPEFGEPPALLSEPCDPLTLMFAGSIHTGFANALQRAAEALRRINGRLVIYGPPPHPSQRGLLEAPNIELRGFVPSAVLIQQCRDEGHAMLLIQTHEERDRPIAEISFPSKLADMTAVGLPLVMDGPAYWSAIRWAQENDGVAEIVTDASVDSLGNALERLKDTAHRVQLARNAISLGQEYFSRERAVSTLYNKLVAGSAPSPLPRPVRPMGRAEGGFEAA